MWSSGLRSVWLPPVNVNGALGRGKRASLVTEEHSTPGAEILFMVFEP